MQKRYPSNRFFLTTVNTFKTYLNTYRQITNYFIVLITKYFVLFFLLSSPSLVSNSLFSLYPIFEEFQFRCNTMKTRSIPVKIYSGWYCNLINQCFCEWGPIEHYFMIDRCTWNWLTRPWKRVKYNVKVCNPWKKKIQTFFHPLQKREKTQILLFLFLMMFLLMRL